jgi:hypothetical protein
MGPNRRAQERDRAAAIAAERAKRAEADRKAIADAQKIVAIWNAASRRREHWFYPTIGAAIRAGLSWLSYSCPACGQSGSVDLTGTPAHQYRACPVGILPAVLAQRAVRQAGNADGRIGLDHVKEKGRRVYGDSRRPERNDPVWESEWGMTGRSIICGSV